MKGDKGAQQESLHIHLISPYLFIHQRHLQINLSPARHEATKLFICPDVADKLNPPEFAGTLLGFDDYVSKLLFGYPANFLV